MRLSVIIVNYKTRTLLAQCLESLYSFGLRDAEVIVVDNDSADGTVEFLAEKFPSVIFIQMGYNSGFARANNAGIRQACGEAILLLNADTLILNNAVIRCAEKLADSEYVAAGVQLLHEDGTAQISGNYAMRGGLNYLLPLPFLGALIKSAGYGFKVKKPNVPEASDTVEVDWINGAFLMVKRDAVAKAGLLDEDFFLYAEEAEWCSRLKRVGPLCVFGELHVTHLQGKSSNAAFDSDGTGYYNLFDRKGLQIMLSNFVRIRKQFGVAWFFFDLLIYITEIPIFFVGLLLNQFAGKKRYTMQQAIGFAANIKRLIRFVPSIVSNRPRFYKVL